MKFSYFIASLVAIAAVSRPALAQREDQFSWGFGGGPTFVTGDSRDVHGTGAHGFGSLGIGMVDSPFGIRFDAMYSSLASKSKTVSTPGGLSTVTQGSGHVFIFSGNGILNIYGSNTHLYALGGLGGYWYNPSASGAKSQNNLALSGGLGLWLNFADLFIEAKYVNLYRALPNPDTGAEGKKSLRLIPVTLGIIF